MVNTVPVGWCWRRGTGCPREKPRSASLAKKGNVWERYFKNYQKPGIRLSVSGAGFQRSSYSF
jgi:hypothetical protein